MRLAVRVLLAAGVAAATLTCADHTVSGLRGGLAKIPIAPAFDVAPAGGPQLDISRIRGVLRGLTAGDTVAAEGVVAGDSVTLQFANVRVTGDSSPFDLGIKAFDKNNVVVFAGRQHLSVKPGANKPATPALSYVAPDVTVQTVKITGATSPIQLDWAGASPVDNSCVNRAASPNAVTQVQLSVVGKDSTGTVVPGTRVGWTSLDTSVATVNSSGLVKSRCSNKSTQVVARTFLNKTDTVNVIVNVLPFSVVMTPDSSNVVRGGTVQLTALTVDENNNRTPASQVSWASSDATRATVSATGLVQGIANGRVVITATVPIGASTRTTVGVVQVVRPLAAMVVVQPRTDSLAFGMVRGYVAKAFDTQSRVIADAVNFQWTSSNAAVATVSGLGLATAQQQPGNSYLRASIDGKSDSLTLSVVQSLQPGTIVSKVISGVNEAPIASATINVPGSSAMSASDGSFTLPGVQAGNDITFAANGYVTATLYNAPSFPNQTLQVPKIPLSPTGGTGSISGKVVNALSSGSVSGATLKAYAGINAAPSPQRPNQPLVSTATTNDTGAYTFNGMAPGVYTLVATATGYSEAQGVASSVGGAVKTPPVIVLPPVTAAGGLYVVLKWGSCGTPNVPCSLDSHLTGPFSISDTVHRFQVYHGSRSYLAGSDTVAALDVDAASGPGPSVLSLRPAAPPGTYHFYVANASNSGVASSRALADSSGARVDVYQNNRVIATFFPPAGQAGTVWDVFRYDGARLFLTGTISTPANPATLP